MSASPEKYCAGNQRNERRDHYRDGGSGIDQCDCSDDGAAGDHRLPAMGAQTGYDHERHEQDNRKRTEAHGRCLRRARCSASNALSSAARACGSGTMNGVIAAARSTTTVVRNARRHGGSGSRAGVIGAELARTASASDAMRAL